MHRLRYILVVTLIVFVAVGAIFLTRAQRASAQAENEVITYLAEKFASREIPVASLQVHRNSYSFLDLISGSPLRVEVIIQSASNGEKVAPDDPVNIQWGCPFYRTGRLSI
jgi:type II secretory pathway pseudopilin PulG